MNLKAKKYLVSQKKAIGDKLAARLSLLKEKGMDAVAINRDSSIKKMRGRIRQADYRLSCIAAQEKINADKALTKTEKLAAKKDAPDKPPAKSAKGAPAKKEKKEKKKAPPPAPDEQE